MKNKHIELDIDFVVDSRPLTKKEELSISEFIKADKEKRALLSKRQSKTVKSKNREKVRS